MPARWVLLLVVALILGGCGGQPNSESSVSETAAETAGSGTSQQAPTATAEATVPEATTAETSAPEAASTEAAATEASPEPEALPGLPVFTAGYEEWPKLNAAPIPPREDGDAHLGTKEVYANLEAGPNGVYPAGSIIVKDAVRPDADFVGLVAVMRKEQGADPAHNDWAFVEYTRDGPDTPFVETASDAVCWGCHMGAAETDYVWIATLDLTR